MPVPTYLSPARRHLAVALAGALGITVGGGLVWLLRDPHTATPETLTGTVAWSNAQDRLIALDVDGVTRDPLGDDTIYYVVSDALNLPPCLRVQGESQVREDRRRVEVQAIHQGVGGRRTSHLAVSLRCLD